MLCSAPDARGAKNESSPNLRGVSLQESAYEFPRINLPHTPVNKDWQKLRLYSPPEKPCEPPSGRTLTNGYKYLTNPCMHRRVLLRYLCAVGTYRGHSRTNGRRRQT